MLMDMAIYIKPTYELVVLSMWPLLSCSIHLMDVYYQNIPLLDGLFGMLAAMFIFHEDIPMTRWMGIFLIMTGCVLVAK